MIQLAISGCQGRMGQSIIRLASEDKNFAIKTLLENKDHPQANAKINDIQISTDINDIKGCNVLIEFTTPEATIKNLQACCEHGVRMVIGTTGLSHEQVEEIKKASKKIPIVYSSNMSVGVNVLFKLTDIAAQKTGHSYSIVITEAHHIHKKDSPSGTAKTLEQIAEKAGDREVTKINSIREGEIVGDHDVIFESEQDIIKLSHHAKNRDIFAKGALVAAKFIAGKRKAGLFNMQDVLGLN
ncbi:MAG: 4-hydroxy-tetrahydrodipicolinate reductase [Candidatus Omnitrophica bacterium]|nr:4-hydroxy-tetrahydrodipicolinate reductase [Candidatus Omnitrophota bacterium]